MSGIFKRFFGGLTRSRQAVGGRIAEAVAAHPVIDPDLLERVEEILITADLGTATSLRLMRAIDDEIRYNKLTDPARLWEILKGQLLRAIQPAANAALRVDHKPTVVLVIGVNGAGKTTTIGKLAGRFGAQGRKVMLAAGDTFRAAAGEQLTLWGRRLGVEVVRHQDGADASAVAFDACQAALARGVDLLLVDTAGRLHTNVNLMAELEKVKRTIGKVIPGAPHEVMLVLDANTGQNALSQARTFSAAIPVTGLVLTKMDSTAKGGILVNLTTELKVPVYFIGIGEGVDDLQPFDPEAYVAALFQH
ncbi:MAG: signal recognition particle-docking protein FtsY [Nitrospirae bacterium]|nr:signal recognition particle-docking protein FtsY [Nitrospirota bacterium]